MSAIRYYRRLAPGSLFLLALLLAACGSSSSNQPPADGPAGAGPLGPAAPDAPAARESGTARFDVDVDTGQVQVTPLAGDTTSRAVFNGSAVTFNAAQLVDQPGSSGIRVLDVSLTNRFGAPIGRDYLRVVISHLTPGNNLIAELRKQVQVSGTSLGLSGLRGLTFAPDGSYLVVRVADNRIYRVQNNQATVFTGRATAGYKDGAPDVAQFSQPNDVVYHAQHNAYYVTDTGNHRIRRVDLNGRVTTVAGTGSAGATNGPGNTATLNAPMMMDVDRNGALVVTTADGRVRRITLGSGSPSLPASYTVATLSSGLTAPAGIAAAPDGSIYVAERTAHRIRVIAPNGSRAVIAGTGTAGQQDGAGDIATFRNPVGLAWVRGALVVADSSGHKIRLVTLAPGTQASTASNWRVVNLAGASDGTSGNAIGQGNAARFNTPWGLRAREDGTVIVVDVQNNAVRRLSVPDGALSTGVGSSATGEPVQVANATGHYGLAQGSRPFFDYAVGAARLGSGATTDAQEWWFSVPDRVRTFSFIATVEASTGGEAPPEGSHQATNARVRIQTVIRRTPGNTTAPTQRDGPAEQATLRSVTYGLAVAPDGVVYIASDLNVRRYDPRTNQITLIAGHANELGNSGGDGTTARFNNVTGIVAPRPDLVYVGDYHNASIWALQLTGTDPNAASSWTVTRILGTGTVGVPTSIAGSPLGNVHLLAAVTDRGIWFTDNQSRICLATCSSSDVAVPSNWRVATLAGSDGVGTTDYPARFDNPRGIAVGSDGAAYVADHGNNKVRRINETGQASTLAGATLGVSPAGYADGAANDARFDQPHALARDKAGYTYVADMNGLRRISPTGQVSTVLKRSLIGADGFGAEASIGTANGVSVVGMAVAPDGDIWLVDGIGLRRVSRVISNGSP